MAVSADDDVVGGVTRDGAELVAERIARGDVEPDAVGGAGRVPGIEDDETNGRG